MRSKGFYSFYVFVLVVLIGLAIMKYFSDTGRTKTEKALDHIWIQMEIFSSNLSELGKMCLRKYSFQQCRVLEFDLDGYKALLILSDQREKVCIADLLIEKISPLDSRLIRYTKREIWDLNNLK